ncbi:hypothetical protein STLA111740_21190 [Stenotrophomonas lactitubi]
MQAPLRAGLEADSRHRRGGLVAAAAAVVRVAPGDVAIIRFEAHRAVAHSGQQRPARAPLPPRLGELVHVLHDVDLVAAQAPAHAQGGADEVLVASAVLALTIGIHAHHQIQRAAPQIAVPAPACVQPAIAAIQVDHATGMQWVGLRSWRNRQVLGHRALPGIAHQLPALRAGFPRPTQAGLLLAHRFAGVVLVGHRRRLTRVGRHLRAAQSQRVLRVGRVQRVEQQFQAAASELGAQPRVQRLAARTAVVTPTIGAEMVGGHVVVDALAGPAQLRADAERVVGTGIHAQPPRVTGLALRTPHLQYAPGRVAVQGRERPAQHLDALGTEQAGVRQLALPIGHGRRYAVDQHTHPAHAEGRACAEASDRQLGVLREVLPVAGQEARHPAQRLGQLRVGAGTVSIDPHRIQAGGQGEGIHAWHPRGLHLHSRQRGGRGLGPHRQRRQQQGGQRQAMTSCGGIHDSG